VQQLATGGLAYPRKNKIKSKSKREKKSGIFLSSFSVALFIGFLTVRR
jgi:hypothetical protein